MPIGIITNVGATLIGGVLGLMLGNRLPQKLKDALNNILGVVAISMGIVLILKQHTMSAVVLASIVGCIIGELLGLENKINGGVTRIVTCVFHSGTNEELLIQIGAVMVLFCCSGTGWYGALNEGLTGDGSILITKSILDLITAVIFGSVLGKVIPLLCVPQAMVYGVLFLLSGFVQPFITPDMIGDFSATGGILTLCAGLRLTGIKRDIKILNLLPALLLSFFVSAGWSALFS